MQKNKVTTYLLYAIGEIVLVVIGILIAVSINNWNQAKQQRKEEKELLLSLLKESEENMVTIQRFWSFYRSMDPHIRTLLDNVGDVKSIANQDLGQSIIYLNYYRPFNFDLTIGTYALNNGKISLIKNDDLRKNIQILIPSVGRLQSSRTIIQKELDQMFNDPIIRKYYRNREARYPSGYGDAGPSKFSKSFLPLLEEPVFETYLENIRVANSKILELCIRTFFNLENSIRALKEELVTFGITSDSSTPELKSILFPFNDFDHPEFLYYAWANDRVPRWRDLSDSLMIEFYGGNVWASWQATRLGYFSDYSKYSGLELELKCAENTGLILFGLKDINDSDAESGHEIELNLTKEWQTFKISFEQYEDFDPTQFHYMKLIHLNKFPVTVLVKRIEFIE